jgi:protein tyrosine phosphatase
MENTTEDFWKMVYEQKAQAILMLTALDESGSVSLTCNEGVQ